MPRPCRPAHAPHRVCSPSLAWRRSTWRAALTIKQVLLQRIAGEEAKIREIYDPLCRTLKDRLALRAKLLNLQRE